MPQFALCDDNFPSLFDSPMERERWAAYWGACGDLDQVAATGDRIEASDFSCVLYLFYTVSDGGEVTDEPGDDIGGLVSTQRLPAYWTVVAMSRELGRRPSFAEVFPPDQYWGELTKQMARLPYWEAESRVVRRREPR